MLQTFIVVGIGASLVVVGLIIVIGWKYVPCFKRQKALRFLRHIDTGSVKVTWVTYQIIASTSFNLDIEVSVHVPDHTSHSCFLKDALYR
jgi:hypothetical protein